MVKVFFAVLLVLFPLALGQSCTADWQCPDQPFRYCSSPCTDTLPGVVVDTTNNKVYWISRCGAYPNPAWIQSANLDGTGYQKMVMLSEIIGNSGFSEFTPFGLPMMGISNGYFYIQRSQRLSPEVSAVDRTTFVETKEFYNRGFNIDFAADEANHKLYTCEFGLKKYSCMTPSQCPTDDYLYEPPARCQNLAYNGANLFIHTIEYATSSSAFWTADTNCLNCTSAFTAQFSLTNEFATAFGVSTTKLYWSTDNHIGEANFDGSSSRIVVSEGANAIRYHSNRIFYNNGTHIKSVDVSTGVITIISPTSSASSCECRSGFSGANCQGCSGKSVWVNGQPQCLAPNACLEDWHCGNVPFSICSAGQCRCADGFSGPNCQTCPSNVVRWDLGYPMCLPIGGCAFDWQCSNFPYSNCDNGFYCQCAPGFTGTGCSTCNPPATVQWTNGRPSCQ